jgi:two-component system, NtrC family, sensor kinase
VSHISKIHPGVQEIARELDSKRNSLNISFLPKAGKLIKKGIAADDTVAAGYGYFFTGRIHESMGEIETALENYYLALEMFQSSGLPDEVILCLCMIGYCKGYFSGQFSEGIEILKEAELLAKKLSFKKGIAIACNSLGVIYYLMGNFNTSLEYHQKSLDIGKEEGNKQQMATSFNNIAVVMASLQKNEAALHYFSEVISCLGDTEKNPFVADCHNNIGVIYRDMKNNDKAYEHFSKAEKLYLKLNNKHGLAGLYCNIGSILIEQNDLIKSRENLDKALMYATESKANEFILNICIAFAKLSVVEKKYPEAIHKLKESLITSKQLQLKTHERDILDKLHDVYYLIEDFKEALEYYRSFVKIRDEILNEEAAKKIKSLEYEATLREKGKEAEIERLKNVELKKAYEDLKRAQDELIRKERMAAIGKIASEIAHEVQNPLNFVNNFSELNKEIAEELNTLLNNAKETLPDEVKELLKSLIQNSESINTNGKRASGIVSQLLELTRKGEIHKT